MPCYDALLIVFRTAKKLCDHLIVPILDLCGVKSELVRTEYAGFATEYVQGLGTCNP